MWRLSRAWLWLGWAWLCLFSSAVTSPSQSSDDTFHFTQPLYTATISEKAHGKAYVVSLMRMGIHRHDTHVNIEYKIDRGDKSSIFRAEAECILDFCFLRIRTRTDASGELNREHKDMFDLRVKAVGRNLTDTVFTAHTNVDVTVLDENDLSPLFYPVEYDASVPENTTLHKGIVTLTASDADIGVNGEIYYSFVQLTKVFSIHPTTGVVSLRRHLNYSEKQKHKLVVLAEDRGPKTPGGFQRTSSASLTISVLPVNYFHPVITVKKLPVLVERGDPGTTYAFLTVLDKDYGKNGIIDTVEISEGNEDNMFTLVKSRQEEGVYKIVVSGMLDREKYPNGYNMTVSASDRGSPSLTSTVDVHVSIQDTNNQPPAFSQSKYSVSVSEVAPVNTPVLRVRAGDLDLGRNADVEYTIIGSNEAPLFKIDRESGLISTTTLLDAEAILEVTVKVQAEDLANYGPRNVGTADVKITVLDFNDNPPVFKEDSLSGAVKENLPAGTSVLSVSATDVDSGENGRISYSIVNAKDVPFEINHFTGALKTTEMLDFEKMRRTYYAIVRASDWGSPHRRESEAVVTIKLENENDNVPMFEKVQCTGSLSRRAPKNTEIVLLPAIDFDENSIISYSISRDTNDCFKIGSSTGSITLGDCDLYGLHTMELVAVASDGTHMADTTVALTLVDTHSGDVSVYCNDTDATKKLQDLISTSNENNKDIDIKPDISHAVNNDYAPEFASSVPKYFEVSEATPVGTSVLNMTATDRDSNAWFNSKLLYVISKGNSDGAFKIDTFTGSLTVMSPLDREVTAEYNLQVAAMDMGNPSHSAKQLLRVVIIDENDNPPVFEHASYEKSIFEHVAVNSTVLQVYASDPDKDYNSRIRYSLLSDTPDFYMQAWDGILKVRRQLDRERQAVYELDVLAKDSGLQVQLSSTTHLTIRLEDVNDNRPKFVPSQYTARVREDLPVGSVVMTLVAHDPDVGDNGRVTYTLEDGVDNKFNIDEETGTIRIQDKLDYESKQVYNITARAEDHGEAKLISTCLVNIEVVDVDENYYPPTFKEFVKEAFVYENQVVGTIVTHVRAEDPSGTGETIGQVRYSIQDGTGLGRFSIDNNGTIRTSQILDTETTSHYWLTVFAQDGGLVPRFARQEVLVKVVDQNDNVPQTEAVSYEGSILENSPPGVSILQLKANDADLSDHGRLTFNITGGDPQNFFYIHPSTGLLTTTRRKLNREYQDQHSLEVTVSDNNPRGPLSSATRVLINVLDENDERPRFADKAPFVQVLEAPHTGHEDLVVYQVVARDKDTGINAHITYSIKPQRGSDDTQFRIHPTTGIIYSTGDLVIGQRYQLKVKAQDGGEPQRRDSIKLLIEVVGRPVGSTHPPKFSQSSYSLSVAENEPIGQLVEMLSGEDDDGDKIWYSIKGGNMDEKFGIQSEHGTLYVAGQLDWETQPHYNLTICATDGVADTCVPVFINVMDNNEFAPEFSEEVFQASVSESADRGTSVITVSASDRDEDKRLIYTISHAASTASLHHFNIHHQSGLISIAEPLDREVLSHHGLTVMVRDLGTPIKRSFARVNITVLDHNDHPPHFLSNTFEGRVFETASLGTSVLQVQATDRDKGENSEITYSIVSGNIGGTFSIDDRLGIITVVRALDRSVKSHYDLGVVATDHGAVPLSATAQVTVHVTLSNNSPPRFSQQEYTVDLMENEPAGHIVVAVHAESQSSVVYEIRKGNHLGLLTINPNSGVISTKSSVDYEENHLFTLSIFATNIVGSSSNCTVTIHVLDENDNHPEFAETVYTGTISESANPNSMIINKEGAPLVVKATDKDYGINALLRYEIEDPKIQAFFAIDPATGALKTRSTLDHETRPVYNFTVTVSDQGTPSLMVRSPAQVVIHVEDVNDSPPMFTNHSYHARVLLPTYKDVTVLHLLATDPDSYTPLVYSIVKGNNDGAFDVHSDTGELFVSQEDYLADKYTLTVQVSDGKWVTTARVIVNVQRTLSSGLHFSQPVYNVKVSEEKAESKELIPVMAVGHRLNEPLEFRLLNNRQFFRIKRTSGVLESLAVDFDREERSNYTVIIEVRDQHGRQAHGVVMVEVEDSNDNSPQFLGLPYNSVIAVNSSRGDVVKKVVAVDADAGNNGQVRYSITDGSQGRFNINLVTGEVTVERLLPSDTNKVFTLTVEAQDMGQPPQRQYVDVPIHVVATHSPLFRQQVYNVSVRENTAMHTPITKIEAVSPSDHKLIYSISEGDKYGDFAVNFDTGLISVVGSLDYEAARLYNLTLRATDIRTGAYTEALVFIHLQDTNDNAPVFTSEAYTEAVSESTPVGTEILQVLATDPDTHANNQVHYSLAPVAMGNHDVDSFHIDSETGRIWLKKKLDYEVQSDYYFLVIAIDNGMPALNTTVIVHVRLLNLNDNPPRFSQTYYECFITDKADRGQLVTKVIAFDDDQSPVGSDHSDIQMLFYSIVDGNTKQTFAMDTHTGLVTVSEQRTPDFEVAYMLNVSVSDGVYTDYARVTIAVRNTNQHGPVFPEAGFSTKLSEMTAPGMPVMTVTAEDEDRGANGLLTYSIPSDRMKKMFHIDADTGEVSTKTELDRETQSVYNIPVAATDGGGRMGYTWLKVTVTDYNDCIPRFVLANYQGNIYANASVGAVVLQVSAQDLDADVNGEVRYSLDSSTNPKVTSLFDLDPRNGLIRVRGDLSRQVNKVFQFFVGAANSEDSSMQDRAAVDILVMGPRSSPPVFEKKHFEFFVKEDVDVGSVVGTVKAESEQNVKYTLYSGGNDEDTIQAFTINHLAQITISEKLDHEKVPSFHLTLKAETEAIPPLVAYTQVVINVGNVNDNNPIFDSNPFLASINEDALPETKVIQLTAFDEDSPTSFRFSFGDGMEDVANVFSLDPHSGWLTLMARVDREDQDEFNISLKVCDADPRDKNTRCSDGRLIVSISDVNDSPPVFPHHHYKTAVDEGAALGTVLRNISASDRDIGENAEISYYITAGDPLGQFQVHSTAEIFVNRPLDRESCSGYKLTVAGTDGRFVSYITVSVEILDDNDHSPLCEKSLYTKLVAENTATNTVIEHIHATDADEANTRNSKLTYSLKGFGADVFSIDQHSGAMKTVKALDREQQAEYRLVATATDGGGRSCMTDIYVTVTDINDNRPEFTLKTTTFIFPENAQKNALLTRVTAVDADSGMNRRINFELGKEHSDVFEIDAVSGIISVKKSLDREAQSKYFLTVIAFNPGFRQLSSTTKLEVLVGDENDNPPRFQRTDYYAEVREDEVVDSLVTTVTATSQDIGVNAQITYSIAGGNEQGKFRIHPESGTVRVAEPLDHELSAEYFLTLVATDRGEHPLSSTAVLVVNVTDANDNAPQFGQTAYTCSVKEDLDVNMEVIRVQATDVDSPINANIKYSIIKGDVEGKFTIGSESGVIRVKQALDREMVDRYALIVEAQDSGLFIPRSATAVVSIELMDANDNPPRFSQANYTARVQEGRHAGISILQFAVTDIDLEENGPPFDFDIVNGNVGRAFHVNKDGLLLTAAKLSKELKEIYNLTIRVFDSGQPIQYADTHVEVVVVDESMYPPVVRNLSITISSYKDRFAGGIIGKVDYQDDDLYDTITFQVVSHNRYLFEVDRESGNVIAPSGLDAGLYMVNVSVFDGKFTSYSLVTVNVVSISEEMVNNAITIQFENMIPEQFFASSKKAFQATLKKELDVSGRSIEIINVQPATSDSGPPGARRRRDAGSDLDVLFAVSKSGGRFFNKNSLRKKVTRAIPAIEMGVGAKVKKVFSDLCDESSCSEGVCEGKVVFDNNKLTPVIVGGESFVSARHYYSFHCICPSGNCKSQICGGTVCPSYKLCEQDDFGQHVCVCPNGMAGELCDEEPPDCKPSDVNCRRGELPMTFSGQSYARWQIGVKTDRHLSLSLWIRTRKLNANIMNSKGHADYSMLEIINGRVQYKFNCGSGEGLVTVPVVVNDGRWHKVSVERNGRMAQMELDELYHAITVAPGVNDVLNLASDNIYFGAEVAWHSNYQAISHGFEGCMKDIRLFDMPLLFNGKNKVTQSQQFEKIDFNCKEDPWQSNPNICSSHPCMHGGACVYTGLNKYICQCKPRYLGSKCEVDTNPCEDSPCLHRGECVSASEVPNGFKCVCAGRYQGRKCEYGGHCIPNPCHHGGTCIEGPQGAMCQCKPGYDGTNCELMSSVCGVNPCQHGGTCHLYTGGAYHCNCTSDRTGPHCEELALPVITGGIRAEEIYGIAGVGAGLILIVLVFVACRLWRKRKRNRQRGSCGIIRDGDIQYHGMKEHELKRKLSDPDLHTAVHTYTTQPPPVPTRPASYTPSTHDSLNALNNFDTVRNYGSAADELETTGIQNIPTFQEYLETFQSSHRGSPAHPSPLALPQRSNPNSDSDSIQKQPWEFDYPNILEQYPEADKKAVHSKLLPGLGPCSQVDASSYSSLPVSESEEDLNVKRSGKRKGYHWDTSDWAPRPSLPNISEVPAREIPDSPASSRDSNPTVHISGIEPETDDPADYGGDSEYVEDSEYVGDSEYAENEFGLDEADDLPPCYADHPNYEQILELRDMEDPYELPTNLQVSHHPNHYLPNYSFGAGPAGDHADWPAHTSDEDNSNVSGGEGVDNDKDSVVRYGYPNMGAANRPQAYVAGSDIHDHDRSAASILDDMSVSVGGYTSTNGSCSDVSAYLCEIEDSEINQSEGDSEDDDEEDLASKRLLSLPQFHTKV